MQDRGPVAGLDPADKGVLLETLASGTRLEPSLADLHFASLDDLADLALALSTRQLEACRRQP
jgi:hypothetical protein